MKSHRTTRPTANLVALMGGAMLLLAATTGTMWNALGKAHLYRDVVGDAFWATSITAFFVSGSVLFLTHELGHRRVLRWCLALIAFLSFALFAVLSYAVGAVTACVLGVLMCIVVPYAVMVDGSGFRDRRFDLAVLLPAVGAVLAFLVSRPFLAGSDVLTSALSALVALVGAAVIAARLKGRNAKVDDLLRFALGVGYATISFFAVFHATYLTAIAALVIAVPLLLYAPYVKLVSGRSQNEEDLPDEARLVDTFARIDERGGFLASNAIFVTMFFYPEANVFPVVLWGLMNLRAISFIVNLWVADPAKRTLRWYHRQLIVNLAFIILLSFLMGGLQGPFTIIMPFMIIGGLLSPRPFVLRFQLVIVPIFLLLLAAHSWLNGTFTREDAFTKLLPLIIVVFALYYYVSRLATQRNIDDARLREANAALTLANERDAALFKALADSILVCDLSGTVTQTNPALLALIRDEVDPVGRHPDDILPLEREDGTEFSFGTLISAAGSGRSSLLPEGLFFERNGSRVHVSGYATPFALEDRSLSGIIITLRDVTTERKADMVKSDFLSIAAHQLRTPITGIRWHLDLIRDAESIANDESTKRYIENAYGSTKGLVALINGILAAARLESGRVPFSPEPVVLSGFIDGIIELVRPKAEEKGVELSVDVPDLPPIRLDPVLTTEVFKNLIENGIRYVEEGGNVAVTAKEEGEDVVVTVKDDGIGIPEDQQKNIFTKFFRAKNAIAHTGGGTGLGLFLARYIANAWGGDITFDSKPGKGTSFYVTIPKKGMPEKGGSITLHA